MVYVGVLFAAGIVLILAEFVIPGAVIGILGGSCIVASVVLGWKWYPEYGIFILLGEVVGLGLAIAFGIYLMSRSRVGRVLVQTGVQRNDEGYASHQEDPALIGREGEAHSALRPAGVIMVDGRRIDAVSSGTFINKGARVRVIDVEGHRVVVEEAAEKAQVAG